MPSLYRQRTVSSIAASQPPSYRQYAADAPRHAAGESAMSAIHAFDAILSLPPALFMFCHTCCAHSSAHAMVMLFHGCHHVYAPPYADTLCCCRAAAAQLEYEMPEMRELASCSRRHYELASAVAATALLLAIPPYAVLNMRLLGYFHAARAPACCHASRRSSSSPCSPL